MTDLMKIVMKKPLALIITLLFAIESFSQDKPVEAFTVKEAVDYALQNNTAAKNAKLGVSEAKWRNLEIYTQGLPQISASLDYSYYFKTPQFPGFNKFFSDSTSSTARVFNYLAATDPNISNILRQSYIESKDKKLSFVLPHNLTTGLQVTQLLFDGRYIFGIKASKDLMRTARLSSQASDQEIKYAVMKAYYQAEAAQESKGLLAENLKLIEKLVNDTRATFKEGLIEELDVNRLELVQVTLENQINLQNQMADVALANLKFQMGMKLDDEIILKNNLAELKAEVPQQLLAQFDATQRVEYQLLETAIRLKGYDMRQKRVQYYPSLYSYLNYGWAAQGETMQDFFKTTTIVYPDGDTRKSSSWYDQGLVGLTLKVPIFDSGLKLAQVKQAKIEQIKTANDFENFKNASQLQFKVAQSGFNSALVDEANSTRTQELSKKIFDKNTAKFKEGVGSSFELVQSEQDYITNQLKHIQSSLNVLNTKADLDKAMGVK
jgi:outer membrane protein